MQARGIRNNNPGNIKYGSFARSMGANGKDSGGHAIFPSPEQGVAAIVALNRTYERKGWSTINERVKHWSQKPGVYAATLSKALGIPANRPFSIDDPGVAAKFVAAMIRHENGYMPYVPGQIEAGLALVNSQGIDQRLSGAAATRTLRKGMHGDDVKLLQNKLTEQGFYRGKWDGIYGKQTAAAVKAAEAAYGLPQERRFGKAGPQVQTALAAHDPMAPINDAERFSLPRDIPVGRYVGPIEQGIGISQPPVSAPSHGPKSVPTVSVDNPVSEQIQQGDTDFARALKGIPLPPSPPPPQGSAIFTPHLSQSVKDATALESVMGLNTPAAANLPPWADVNQADTIAGSPSHYRADAAALRNAPFMAGGHPQQAEMERARFASAAAAPSLDTISNALGGGSAPVGAAVAPVPLPNASDPAAIWQLRDQLEKAMNARDLNAAPWTSPSAAPRYPGGSVGPQGYYTPPNSLQLAGGPAIYPYEPGSLSPTEPSLFAPELYSYPPYSEKALFDPKYMGPMTTFSGPPPSPELQITRRGIGPGGIMNNLINEISDKIGGIGMPLAGRPALSAPSDAYSRSEYIPPDQPNSLNELPSRFTEPGYYPKDQRFYPPGLGGPIQIAAGGAERKYWAPTDIQINDERNWDIGPPTTGHPSQFGGQDYWNTGTGVKYDWQTLPKIQKNFPTFDPIDYDNGGGGFGQNAGEISSLGFPQMAGGAGQDELQPGIFGYGLANPVPMANQPSLTFTPGSSGGQAFTTPVGPFNLRPFDDFAGPPSYLRSVSPGPAGWPATAIPEMPPLIPEPPKPDLTAAAPPPPPNNRPAAAGVVAEPRYPPSQTYGGSPGAYSFAGMLPWGSATYTMPGGGYSNSPYTPGANAFYPGSPAYTPPSFDSISGGPTYAYHPDGYGGGTFITSDGRVMSY